MERYIYTHIVLKSGEHIIKENDCYVWGDNVFTIGDGWIRVRDTSNCDELHPPKNYMFMFSEVACYWTEASKNKITLSDKG